MSESILRTTNIQDFEPLARLFDSYRQFYEQALYESLGWVRDEVFYAYSKQT